MNFYFAGSRNFWGFRSEVHGHFKDQITYFNSLAPGWCGNNLKSVIFKLIIQNKSWCTYCEFAPGWMPQSLTNEKSILVHVQSGNNPHSKVHGAHLGPTWGPMKIAIWESIIWPHIDSNLYRHMTSVGHIFMVNFTTQLYWNILLDFRNKLSGKLIPQNARVLYTEEQINQAYIWHRLLTRQMINIWQTDNDLLICIWQKVTELFLVIKSLKPITEINF